jgi:hypothetical protein
MPDSSRFTGRGRKLDHTFQTVAGIGAAHPANPLSVAAMEDAGDSRGKSVEPGGFESLTSALQRRSTVLVSASRHRRTAESHHCSSRDLSA